MDTQTTPQRTSASRSTKKIILLSSALIIALAIASVFFVLWLNRADEITRLKQVDTNSSSKINQLQKQLEKNQTTAAIDKAGDVAVDTPAVATNEDAAISAVVIAYAHASKGSESATFTIQAIKKDANFARVGVATEDGPGYFCVTKKVDTLWLVLYCGQADPGQSELDRWGVPIAMQNN